MVLAIVAIPYLRRTHVAQGIPGNGQHKLVVLPFENLSGDPAQGYFSDGLTEETITDLGTLSPAHRGVIARTSEMSYKHSSKTVDQIGRELGVDYVLEGSIRTEDGRTRISAQLIRVSDQIHLWAQNYDAREKGDLLEIENAIGKAIADQVRVNIVPQHQRTRSVNAEAYDLYLKGRCDWNKATCFHFRVGVLNPVYRDVFSIDRHQLLATGSHLHSARLRDSFGSHAAGSEGRRRPGSAPRS